MRKRISGPAARCPGPQMESQPDFCFFRRPVLRFSVRRGAPREPDSFRSYRTCVKCDLPEDRVLLRGPEHSDLLRRNPLDLVLSGRPAHRLDLPRGACRHPDGRGSLLAAFLSKRCNRTFLRVPDRAARRDRYWTCFQLYRRIAHTRRSCTRPYTGTASDVAPALACTGLDPSERGSVRLSAESVSELPVSRSADGRRPGDRQRTKPSEAVPLSLADVRRSGRMKI